MADPEVHAAPRVVEKLFERLRTEAPIAWCESVGDRPGFWAASRYNDVLSVCRRRDLFVSSRGNVLDTLLHGGDSAANKMLAVSDGQRHTQLRSNLIPAFTPHGLKVMAEAIARRADELVAGAAKQGECDFATEVAQEIPLTAICDTLGVPADDRQLILRYTSSSLSADTPTPLAQTSRMSRMQLLLYFQRHLRSDASRRSDVIRRLRQAADSDLAMTEEEVVLNCYSLILGGDETTRLAMIGAVAAFAEHPEKYEALRSGDVDIAAATEELLRWTTPAMHVGRTVAADTDVLGVAMKKGEIVTGWLSSANRDTAEFCNATELDLSRAPNRHLTFSYGHHFCLGAQLARVEISSLLSAMRRNVRRVESTGTPTAIYSNFLTGYSALPVCLS